MATKLVLVPADFEAKPAPTRRPRLELTEADFAAPASPAATTLRSAIPDNAVSGPRDTRALRQPTPMESLQATGIDVPATVMPPQAEPIQPVQERPAVDTSGRQVELLRQRRIAATEAGNHEGARQIQDEINQILIANPHLRTMEKQIGLAELLPGAAVMGPAVLGKIGAGVMGADIARTKLSAPVTMVMDTVMQGDPPAWLAKVPTIAGGGINIDEYWNSIRKGWFQHRAGNLLREARDTKDPAVAAEAARYQEMAKALPENSVDRASKGGTAAYFKEFARNPINFIAQIQAQSLIQFIPGMVEALPDALASGGVTPVANVAASFLASQSMEEAGLLADLLERPIEQGGAGIDITDASAIEKALTDPEMMERLNAKAKAKGLGTGFFDGVSAAVGGSMVSRATRPGRRMIEAWLKEMGIQAGLGGVGEPAGNVLAGEPTTIPGVASEMLGEVSSQAPIRTAIGTALRTDQRRLTRLREIRGMPDSPEKADLAAKEGFERMPADILLRADRKQWAERQMQKLRAAQADEGFPDYVRGLKEAAIRADQDAATELQNQQAKELHAEADAAYDSWLKRKQQGPADTAPPPEHAGRSADSSPAPSPAGPAAQAETAISREAIPTTSEPSPIAPTPSGETGATLENVPRFASTSRRTQDEATQEDALVRQMQGESVEGRTRILRSLPQRAHAEMEAVASAYWSSAPESEREIIRSRLPESRKNSPPTLSDLWEPAIRNAPSRLLASVVGHVALQGMPQKTTSAIPSDKQAGLNVQTSKPATTLKSLADLTPEAAGLAADVQQAEEKAAKSKDAIGKVTIQGLPVAIETPKGERRKPEFEPLKDSYGRIQRTTGADGEPVDVFINSDRPESGKVFVIDQLDPKTGQFDEHKAVLGAETAAEARTIYERNFEPGWKGFGGITEYTPEAFKSWLASDAPKKARRTPNLTSATAPSPTPAQTTQVATGETRREAIPTAAPAAEIVGEQTAPVGEPPTEIGQKVSKGPAPATFAHIQPGYDVMPDIEMYNLTSAIPGHPAGSTVSRQTLEEAGYSVPAQPAQDGRTNESLGQQRTAQVGPQPGRTEGARREEESSGVGRDDAQRAAGPREAIPTTSPEPSPIAPDTGAIQPQQEKPHEQVLQQERQEDQAPEARQHEEDQPAAREGREVRTSGEVLTETGRPAAAPQAEPPRATPSAETAEAPTTTPPTEPVKPYPAEALARAARGQNPFPEDETVPDAEWTPANKGQLLALSPVRINGNKAAATAYERVLRGLYAAVARHSSVIADLFAGAGIVDLFWGKAGLRKGKRHVMNEWEPLRAIAWRHIAGPSHQDVTAGIRRMTTELASIVERIQNVVRSAAGNAAKVQDGVRAIIDEMASAIPDQAARNALKAAASGRYADFVNAAFAEHFGLDTTKYILYGRKTGGVEETVIADKTDPTTDLAVGRDSGTGSLRAAIQDAIDKGIIGQEHAEKVTAPIDHAKLSIRSATVQILTAWAEIKTNAQVAKSYDVAGAAARQNDFKTVLRKLSKELELVSTNSTKTSAGSPKNQRRAELERSLRLREIERLKERLAELRPGPVQLADTPETAALGVVLQWLLGSNLNAQTEPRPSGRLDSPISFIDTGLTVDDLKNPDELIAAVNAAHELLTGADVRQGDAWSMAVEESGRTPDLGIIADPSYFAPVKDGARSRNTNNYGVVTEIKTPEDLLHYVDEYLMPAWENGARIVLTNTYDAWIVAQLRNRGWTVQEFTRAGEAPEFVAYNFSPTSGEVRPLVPAAKFSSQRRPASYNWNEMVRTFGEAVDPLDAGFILPDGRLLNLHRHRGDMVDHFEVPMWVAGDTSNLAVQRMISAGAIRVNYGGVDGNKMVGFELASIPSDSQMRALNNYIKAYNVEVESERVKDPIVVLDWIGGKFVRTYETKPDATLIRAAIIRLATGVKETPFQKMRRETRFSARRTPEQDAAYLAAVKGDTGADPLTKDTDQAKWAARNPKSAEILRKAVDEAAKTAGYNIKAFHGSPAEDITEFYPFTHIGTEQQVESLSKGREGQLGREALRHRIKRVYPIYAKVENPLRVSDMHDNSPLSLLGQIDPESATKLAQERDAEASRITKDAEAKSEKEFARDWKKARTTRGYGTSLPQRSDLKYRSILQNAEAERGNYLRGTFPAQVRRALIEKMGNHDAFVYANKFEEGRRLSDQEKFARGLFAEALQQDDSYIIPRSNQIKSADLATFRDDGSVIPLSERFNPQEPDIRFSARRGVEGVETPFIEALSVGKKVFVPFTRTKGGDYVLNIRKTAADLTPGQRKSKTQARAIDRTEAHGHYDPIIAFMNYVAGSSISPLAKRDALKWITNDPNADTASAGELNIILVDEGAITQAQADAMGSDNQQIAETLMGEVDALVSAEPATEEAYLDQQLRADVRTMEPFVGMAFIKSDREAKAIGTEPENPYRVGKTDAWRSADGTWHARSAGTGDYITLKGRASYQKLAQMLEARRRTSRADMPEGFTGGKEDEVPFSPARYDAATEEGVKKLGANGWFPELVKTTAPTAEDIRAAEDLKALLERSGFTDTAGVRAVDPGHAPAWVAARIGAEMVGQRLVVLAGLPSNANGAKSPQDDTHTFVSKNTEFPAISTTFHEIWHQFEDRYAGTAEYDAVVATLNELVSKQALAEYQKQFGMRMSENKLRSELYADFFGEQATKKEFWSALYARSPAAVRALIDALVSVWAAIRRIPYWQSVERHFSDVAKARQVALEVMELMTRKDADRTADGIYIKQPAAVTAAQFSARRETYSFAPLNEQTVVPTVTITPAIKDAAMAGEQPLFSARRSQVGSPAFKKWFGKSVVTDEAGQPLVVHHGTLAGKFSVFNMALAGANMGEFGNTGMMFVDDRKVAESYANARLRQAALDNQSRYGMSLLPRRDNYEWAVERERDATVTVNQDEDGWFYSITSRNKFGDPSTFHSGDRYDTEKEAADAGEDDKATDVARAEKRLAEYDAKEAAETARLAAGSAVFDVFLRIVNPMEVDYAGATADIAGISRIARTAKANGHDGVVIRNVSDALDGTDSPSDMFMVFDATQIKSATENRGTFDRRNADIRFSKVRRRQGDMEGAITKHGPKIVEPSEIDAQLREVLADVPPGKEEHRLIKRLRENPQAVYGEYFDRIIPASPYDPQPREELKQAAIALLKEKYADDLALATTALMGKDYERIDQQPLRKAALIIAAQWYAAAAGESYRMGDRKQGDTFYDQADTIFRFVAENQDIYAGRTSNIGKLLFDLVSDPHNAWRKVTKMLEDMQKAKVGASMPAVEELQKIADAASTTRREELDQALAEMKLALDHQTERAAYYERKYDQLLLQKALQGADILQKFLNLEAWRATPESAKLRQQWTEKDASIRAASLATIIAQYAKTDAAASGVQMSPERAAQPIPDHFSDEQADILVALGINAMLNLGIAPDNSALLKFYKDTLGADTVDRMPPLLNIIHRALFEGGLAVQSTLTGRKKQGKRTSVKLGDKTIAFDTMDLFAPENMPERSALADGQSLTDFLKADAFATKQIDESTQAAAVAAADKLHAAELSSEIAAANTPEAALGILFAEAIAHPDKYGFSGSLKDMMHKTIAEAVKDGSLPESLAAAIPEQDRQSHYIGELYEWADKHNPTPGTIQPWIARDILRRPSQEVIDWNRLGPSVFKGWTTEQIAEMKLKSLGEIFHVMDGTLEPAEYSSVLQKQSSELLDAKQFKRVLNQHLTTQHETLRQLVLTHYAARERSVAALIRKLRDEQGWRPYEAALMAQAIDRKMKAIFDAERQKIAKRKKDVFEKAEGGSRTERIVSDLMDMIATGLIESQDVLNAWAQAAGMTEHLTDEHRRKIMQELAPAIRRAEETGEQFATNDAIQVLIEYMTSIMPTSTMEQIRWMMYVNTLSGYQDDARNIVYSAISNIALASAFTIAHPRSSVMAMRHFTRALPYAYGEMAAAMQGKTVQKHLGKLDVRPRTHFKSKLFQTIERIGSTAALRPLLAQDMFGTVPMQYFVMETLLVNQLLKKGMSAGDAGRKAEVMIYGTPEQRKAWKQRAKILHPKSRINQLRSQNESRLKHLDAELAASGLEWASIGMLNNKQEGRAGWLYRKSLEAQKEGRQAPEGRPVLATLYAFETLGRYGLMNMGLYLRIGAAMHNMQMAGFPGLGPAKQYFGAPRGSPERTKFKIHATLEGMGAAVMLAGLAADMNIPQDNDDDDEKKRKKLLDNGFTITALGPKDPRLRAALWDKGWRPFTVKVGDTYIPYVQIVPFGYALAITGIINDWKRGWWGQEDATTGDMLAYLGMGVFRAFSSMSFLQTYSKFLDIGTGNNAKDFERELSALSGRMLGTMVPGAAAMGQVKRWFDKTIYDPRAAKGDWLESEMLGRIVRNIPVLSGAHYRPQINAMGEEMNSEHQGIFWMHEKSHPVLDFLIQHNAVGPVYSKPDPKTEIGTHNMETDELPYTTYYVFYRDSQRAIVKEIQRSMPDWRGDSDADIQKAVRQIVSDTRERTIAMLAGTPESAIERMADRRR